MIVWQGVDRSADAAKGGIERKTHHLLDTVALFCHRPCRLRDSHAIRQIGADEN